MSRQYGPLISTPYTTLPATGVAGQFAQQGGQNYYWNVTFGAWVQFDEWVESALTTAYTNTTTTLSNVFQIPVVANATYAFEWKLIWQVSATSTLMKQAIVVPSGTFNALSIIPAINNGAAAPTFLELATSATSQNGPTAGAASTNMYNQGQGLLMVGVTAGNLSIQAGLTAAGTLTIAKGSILKAKRLA